jgi:hypothetical protein
LKGKFGETREEAGSFGEGKNILPPPIFDVVTQTVGISYPIFPHHLLAVFQFSSRNNEVQIT